jgi:hypothetical protein
VKSRLSPELEERLSLYLDGRLGAAERAAFETLIASNHDLREAVEFHRGLTLEFHEEAPPLPRGYAERARARLAAARDAYRLASGASGAGTGATEGHVGIRVPRPWWRRSFTLQAAGAAAAVTLVFALLYPQIREWGRRDGAGEAPELRPAGPTPARSADQKALADKQTIEALRSLGYLGKGPVSPGQGVKKTPRREKPGAPGASGSRQVPPARSPAPTARARPAAQVAPLPETSAPRASASNVAAATPAPAATANEPPPVAEGATGAPPSASDRMLQAGTGASSAPAASSSPAPAGSPVPTGGSAQAPADVEFRILQVVRGPGPGSDFLAIKSADEWKAFVSDAETPSPAPAVAFDRDMVIVLRDDLKTDPPSRLRVLAVRETAEELLIECRVERAEPASGAAMAGQALLLPKTGRLIRLVMEESPSSG